MSNLPDFESLAVFAKVAEEGSFAAAARQVGMSVPTVSRCIARLEKRLGGRVFNRNSRQLALTEFGRSLIEHANRLCRDAEEVEGAAREMSSTPRGLIRLAAPMSYGLRWVAPILPDFMSAYPQISIDLRLSDAAVDLVGGGFDAALRIAVLPDSSLVAQRLCEVSRFIVAAPSYIKRNGRPSHPRDLKESDCLAYAYRARSDVWHFAKGRSREVTVSPRGRLRANNAELLLPVLLAGQAIAELPEFIAGEYLQDGRLEALIPDWFQKKGGLYFVTPTARSRPTKIDALRDYLVERLANPPWRWP
ncbi:LysR family transcriptional regulator [Sinimarinibacterium flocculans]|uniref:LysR family transcriptional regulator n=1 Tax=Sinimarinibacterium flocculans TaxID=985250 RepID=UPI0035169534